MNFSMLLRLAEPEYTNFDSSNLLFKRLGRYNTSSLDKEIFDST